MVPTLSPARGGEEEALGAAHGPASVYFATLEFVTVVAVPSMAAGAYGTGSCIMADQKAEKTDQIPKRAYLSKTHS